MGGVKTICNAWASDSTIRHKSASGGVTTALAIYLLESGKVDAVLHIGTIENDYLHNELCVSRTRKEICSHCGSRYAPVSMFSNIFRILENNKQEKFCFIGKPCDVAAVRNIIKEYPQYESKFPYLLAIFCAGMPSYNATIQAINSFAHNSTPISLSYRGDGWPGYFTVKYSDGKVNRMTYNESWGKILGRQLGFRCKICPDGIGLLADIASGDSWNTKDGYPDFTESEGRNFCFIRTNIGKQIFDEAVKAGYIETEILDIDKIKDIQRYQYNRRHLIGWRVLVVQLLSGFILEFKGFGFIKTSLKTNFFVAVRDALGTAKRFYKLKKQNG
ncbi:MAG: Coenzyme F420 hydrogenase/dehydrogenase, beta subunit C-terminal domain [Prevotella sp.]|nr:Coenzyme F420 hydrogenase/dehydrogenase, beta subunit C-terminal domain [Prevotella sp.]